MLYMASESTGDGRGTITVTFAIGTDLDAAQVLVQNRVAIALPTLPEEVRRMGVVTQKTSPDFLMVVNLISPDNSLDRSYISNRSEEHTSELQSLMRISYAVFCLTKKKQNNTTKNISCLIQIQASALT